MAIYQHTFRIECDSSRVNTAGETALIDQLTGAPLAIRQAEDVEIQIALFTSGVMLTKPYIGSITIKIFNDIGGLSAEWLILTGPAINASLTVGSWKRGVDYLTAFSLTAAHTAGIVGRQRLVISANLTSSPPGSTGTVVFCNGLFDVISAVPGSIPGTPPIPGPPAAYTKAEADARYAPIATSSGLTAVVGDVNTLKTWLSYAPSAPIKFVAAGAVQALSTGEKLVARTNIAAEQAAVSVGATITPASTYTPDPATYRRFAIALTGSGTFANASAIGSWLVGQTYEVAFTQDSTGGRSVTWGNLYEFPTSAAVDPTPNAVTRLLLRSTGAKVRVVESEPLEAPGLPDVWVHAGKRVQHGTNITQWLEVVSGIAGTVPVPIAYAQINGRPAGYFAGATHLAVNMPNCAHVTGGCTVACVIQSASSAGTQFVARLACIGAEILWESPNLSIGGIGSAPGNRTGMPFPAGGAQRWAFIGTLRALGGGSIALDSSLKTAFGITAAAAPVVGTSHIGSSAGANFFNGHINQVQAFYRELRWGEMTALMRQLIAEMG